MKIFNQLSRADKENIYENRLLIVSGNKIYEVDYSYGVQDFVLRQVMVNPYGYRYARQGVLTPSQVNVMLNKKVFNEGWKSPLFFCLVKIKLKEFENSYWHLALYML